VKCHPRNRTVQL